MEWVREKLQQLDEFKQAFPSVFWCSYVLILMVVAAMMVYFPFLNKVANLEILNVKPFYLMISNNMDTLRWGVIIIPTAVGLIGWSAIDELYQRKLKKYYRY